MKSIFGKLNSILERILIEEAMTDILKASILLAPESVRELGALGEVSGKIYSVLPTRYKIEKSRKFLGHALERLNAVV
ncbi:MAG: hypothetical protein DRJ64_08435 [Thermoprotei archaeon]|nr:MAG: hypothetical protein DRJ64_08435 [Thermoprotei archaeon]